MNTIYLKPSEVPSHLKAGYTGHKFSATISTTGFVSAFDGLWDGGSRTTVRLIELATGRSVPISDEMTVPWHRDYKNGDKKFDLKPGFAVVEHSIFCGKDAGLRFTVHPDDAAKMLPSPVSLTDHERIVLQATQSYKSSYNGQDRYDMAKPYGAMSVVERDARLAKVQAILDAKGDVKLNNGKFASERLLELERWNKWFPSREEWEIAKQSLIAKKLLNRAGAITVEGRNALT